MKRTFSALLILLLVCSLLPMVVSADTPAHTHIYTDWQYNSGQHYKNCTVDGCYEIFFAESHRGGTLTCTQKPICEICGFAYGMTEPDHTWSPTYLYQDSVGHAWICAVCKQHSEVIPHEAGPAGTPGVDVICRDCGYTMIPANNPASSHTHSLSKVPAVEATCLQEGNIEYYRCSGCSDLFTDSQGTNQINDSSKVTVAPLGHAPSDVWGMDENFHWRVCTRCNTVLDETKMQHEKVDEKCTTCNYTDGVKQPESAKKEPAATTFQEQDETNPSDFNWITLTLVGLVCFGAAVTVTVILLKKKAKGGA